MVYFLAGCAVLVLLILGGRLLARVDPKKLAFILRKTGGVVALVAAGFLAIRGASALQPAKCVPGSGERLGVKTRTGPRVLEVLLLHVVIASGAGTSL